MRRVLIPNRGEIAVRIVDACRTCDLECVVGASEADLDGMAARMADRVVCLGPGPARDSYLRPDVVCAGRPRHRLRHDPPRLWLPLREPRLATLAREIGYPVLVKAAGGGGGRGIKRVDDETSSTRCCRSRARRRGRRSPTTASTWSAW